MILSNNLPPTNKIASKQINKMNYKQIAMPVNKKEEWLLNMYNYYATSYTVEMIDRWVPPFVLRKLIKHQTKLFYKQHTISQVLPKSILTINKSHLDALVHNAKGISFNQSKIQTNHQNFHELSEINKQIVAKIIKDIPKKPNITGAVLHISANPNISIQDFEWLSTTLMSYLPKFNNIKYKPVNYDELANTINLQAKDKKQYQQFWDFLKQNKLLQETESQGYSNQKIRNNLNNGELQDIACWLVSNDMRQYKKPIFKTLNEGFFVLGLDFNQQLAPDTIIVTSLLTTQNHQATNLWQTFGQIINFLSKT
jgi:hypothetical protein